MLQHEVVSPLVLRLAGGRPERLSKAAAHRCESPANDHGPAAHLHDGAHSSAVALPHAAEAGLSPDVPELSKRGERVSAAGRPPIHPGSRVPPACPTGIPSLPMSLTPKPT